MSCSQAAVSVTSDTVHRGELTRFLKRPRRRKQEQNLYLRKLPLPASAEVIVLGDTAYDAKVVQEDCAERGYTWIMPANPERVYAGPLGARPPGSTSTIGDSRSGAADRQKTSRILLNA